MAHTVVKYVSPEVIGLGLGLSLVWLVFYRRYIVSLANIPGPFLASFTRAWHIKQAIKGDFNLQLVVLHRKLGHFVRIAPNEVSVSHPDSISKILLAPLAKGPWYRITAVPDGRFQNTFSTLDPDAKREKAKHYASAFTTSNLLQSENQLDRQIEKLQGWLDKYAENQEPMNLGTYFNFIAYDVAGVMMFSKPFGFLETGTDIDNHTAVSVALDLYAAIVGHFYWLHALFVGNPIITQSGILPMGHVYDYTMKAIEERKINADASFDMIAHWLRANEENPKLVSHHDISAQAIIGVVGATDTITIALQALIYHLLKNPSLYRRARSEVEAARAEGRCNTSVVQFADAQKLEYLQACIKETLRVFTPISSAIPRVVSEGGITIHDQTFQKGTVLSVCPWVIHYSEELWGPDASEFNPDRWLDDNAASLERFLIPFGAGWASCPGQNLARIEFSKIAATMLRDYDIRQVDANQNWEWFGRMSIYIKEDSWPVYIKKRIN